MELDFQEQFQVEGLSYYEYGEPQWDPLEVEPIIDPGEVSYLGKLPSIPASKQVVGMEVGDDRVDFCPRPEPLALMLSVQEVIFDMKTSVEDTSISTLSWNFTESFGQVPVATEGSFDYCRKTGDFSNFGYIDCPRLRIIMDTKKGNSTHSNSSVGKCSMLARDTICSRDEFKELVQLSSLMQDSLLDSTSISDPKYLPVQMGGLGARSPYGSPMNLYSYTKTFRFGTYERVYATATHELKAVLNSLELGQPAEPVFSSRLREKQEYLHGTYKEFVLVPERVGIGDPFTFSPEPFYKAKGVSVAISGVETRLIRARRLIGRRAAEVKIADKNRLLQLLQYGMSVEEKTWIETRARSQARREYENALSANAYFQRLINRNASDNDFFKLLGMSNFQVISTGRKAFEISDAYWLHSGGKGRTLDLRDIRTSEDMFLYSEVSTDNTLKVPGIILKPSWTGRSSVVTTTKKLGLYQVSSTQESWADDIISRLSAISPIDRTYSVIRSEFLKDPEWVNDDSLLIERAIEVCRNLPRSFRLILVSSDKKLAKRMSETINMVVWRISPWELVRTNLRDVWTSTTRLSLDELSTLSPCIREQRSVIAPEILIDSGSIMSAAVQVTAHQEESTRYGTIQFNIERTLLDYSFSPERSATYSCRRINRSKVLHIKVVDPRVGSDRTRNRYGSCLSWDVETLKSDIPQSIRSGKTGHILYRPKY